MNVKVEMRLSCIGAIALSEDLFADFNGSVFLSEVHCNGFENDFFDCEYKSSSTMCMTQDDAAVLCQGMLDGW